MKSVWKTNLKSSVIDYQNSMILIDVVLLKKKWKLNNNHLSFQLCFPLFELRLKIGYLCIKRYGGNSRKTFIGNEVNLWVSSLQLEFVIRDHLKMILVHLIFNGQCYIFRWSPCSLGFKAKFCHKISREKKRVHAHTHLPLSQIQW